MEKKKQKIGNGKIFNQADAQYYRLCLCQHKDFLERKDVKRRYCERCKEQGQIPYEGIGGDGGWGSSCIPKYQSCPNCGCKS